MTKEATLSIEVDAADSDTLFDFRSFKITFSDELKVLETEQIELQGEISMITNLDLEVLDTVLPYQEDSLPSQLDRIFNPGQFKQEDAPESIDQPQITVMVKDIKQFDLSLQIIFESADMPDLESVRCSFGPFNTTALVPTVEEMTYQCDIPSSFQQASV